MTFEPSHSRLPTVPTPLCGREREIEQVASLLLDPEVRLVTLTGPGGIGKTRLAIEAARHVEGSFASDVHFVSLGELSGASLVAAELAKAIGAMDTGRSLQQTIVERLSRRRALMVLDTFEHLIPAAPLVYSIIQECPDVTVLLTSRTAIRLRGEREFPVPPLPVPPYVPEHAEGLTDWPATALFVEQARAVRPDVEIDGAGTALIVEICRNLDGLPLAIELAAARVKHLPLLAIHDQLGQRLRLLVGGALDLPGRQRTIRDSVAWSFELLPAREQQFFRRLAVFSGGWDLAGAAAVHGDDQAADVLDLMSGLVDHSLVALDATAANARYDMLEVVRDYASERLAHSAERETVAGRHAEHYARLAEQVEPSLVRSGHRQGFARLDLERRNFRRALEWAIEHREATLGLRLIVALWRYWRHFGAFVEGRRWCDRVLAIKGEAPASLRSKALSGAAALAFPQGDYARMAALAADAMELAHAGGDALDVRNALTVHGMVALGQERFRDALTRFDEALAVCDSLGATWQLGSSHLNRGLALLNLERPADASEAFRKALELYRTLGDDVFAARAVNYAAHATLLQGNVRQAESLAYESVAASARAEERQGVADALVTLAVIAAGRSDVERAATLRGAVDAIRESLVIPPASLDRAIIRRFEQALDRVRNDARWEPRLAAGRDLSLGAAVEYALHDTSS